MASLIPKIKIGKASGKREKHNLSFDCSTTANIGNIQPTMCREMVPNSKLKVKVSSLVRLSSMPVPTFGRISLRHYHTFIPYIDLWQPFDAMMSGQHYQGSNVASFIPSLCPYFTMHDIQQFILNYSDISICIGDDISHPLTITTTTTAWDGTVYETRAEAEAADLARVQEAWGTMRQGLNTIFGGQTYDGLYYGEAGAERSDMPGVLRLGSYAAYVKSTDSTLVIAQNGSAGNVMFTGGTPIDFQGADLITRCGNWTLLLKFKAPLKRLRTIFIGLGYQFSPYNTLDLSVLKLLAYYKAWFALFRPNREITFVDTKCYSLIKELSQRNGVNAHTGIGNTSIWEDFIKSLMMDCYYYLPMDYFSMAVTKPANGNQDTDFIINSGSMAGAYQNDGASVTNDNVTAFHSGGSSNSNAQVKLQSNSSALSPLNLKLAMKMLTWANKNTVIGRSIREYLKVHFGITDTSTIDDDAVYRIGSSRTNIQISDIMSTAESEQGYLGEYGGRGIGYGDSEKFDFTADKFGVWLTLSVVVPESGYYQGYLKENRHLNRYQFFNPEFDALGYQVLERGEIMDDYNCDNSEFNPTEQGIFNRQGAFGFVPRYSEYKVGRNIVNGDLSLVGLYNSMAPYTLDRRISSAIFGPYEVDLNSGKMKYKITAPRFMPTVVYDNFRRIDPTDHLGQYNRIFNYVTNDLDHFIIHNVFDVDGYLPMKSLTDSFDTVASDDDGTVEMQHS